MSLANLEIVMTDLLELVEEDIPGAILSEPFEAHTNPSLRWWLLCRGVQASMKHALYFDKKIIDSLALHIKFDSMY